jgi:hypothetical protein
MYFVIGEALSICCIEMLTLTRPVRILRKHSYMPNYLRRSHCYFDNRCQTWQRQAAGENVIDHFNTTNNNTLTFAVVVLAVVGYGVSEKIIVSDCNNCIT